MKERTANRDALEPKAVLHAAADCCRAAVAGVKTHVAAAVGHLNRHSHQYVTKQKFAAREIERMNRALQTIVACSEAMVRASNEQELLDATCRIMVNTGGYRMAWIGYAEPDKALSIRPVAQAGFENGFLKSMAMTWAEGGRGLCPVGKTLRTGESQACPDIAGKPANSPWHDQAIRRGYRSSITLPLTEGGRAFGALDIYADQPQDFDDMGLAFLQELAVDLALSIVALRTRDERAAAEEKLRQAHAELELRVEERTAELAIACDRARQADHVKSAFLASMSHELRTPLNSIIGFTGILMQGLAGPLNAEQSAQLGMVQNSSRHLLSLINDVLDLSKIEAGQLTVAQEPFRMTDTIDSVVGTLRPLAEQKGLAIETCVAPEDVELVSDQRRVEQVLINLVSNALKFTTAGHVRIDCRPEEGLLVTRVADTGIGIQPEDMDKLFGMFQQIPEGQPRRGGGTGLGLAVSKKLVEALGGSIEVESHWGAGSTFTFKLPLERRPEHEADDSPG